MSLENVLLTFIDLETTGMRPDRGAKIIEAVVLNRYDVICNWKMCNSSREKIDNELLIEIRKVISKGVVIGHNLPFDAWFISYECEKRGLEGLSIRFIDTLSLSRKILPERQSYKLSDLLNVFDIKVNGELHTAAIDAAATRALFWKLIEKGGISTAGEAGMKKMNWSSF